MRLSSVGRCGQLSQAVQKVSHISAIGPLKKVSAVSEYVAVGYFRDARRSENGENYKVYKALVVAHQPNKSIQTRLVLDSSVTKITVTGIKYHRL